MNLSKISGLSVYLPERIVTNHELETKVRMIPAGGLQRLFGISERRFAAADQQVSDLAVAAARPIVDQVGAENIDYLIFAAACADLIEPATANMVQYKLGLHCPVMDLKNACNSFTTGLMTAGSLISSGLYQNVLLVNGEKLSDAIRYDFEDEAHLLRHLAAFSLGDAGAAAMVSRSDDSSGIYFQKFMTRGEHWALCTIQGGGSMFPRDTDKTYFQGETAALKAVLAGTAGTFFHACLDESGWEAQEIKHFFTHQVSVGTSRLIAQMAGVNPAAIEAVFPVYGNTAAASIPLAMHRRLSRGEIKKGDKIVWFGLAAGVSLSVQMMIW